MTRTPQKIDPMAGPLRILGLKFVPRSGLSDLIYSMRHARREYIDFLIIEEMVCVGEVDAAYLDEQIGCGIAAVTGRLVSLRSRKLVKQDKSTGEWKLTAGAERKAGLR